MGTPQKKELQLEEQALLCLSIFRYMGTPWQPRQKGNPDKEHNSY
jgi:hypothetical protein